MSTVYLGKHMLLRVKRICNMLIMHNHALIHIKHKRLHECTCLCTLNSFTKLKSFINTYYEAAPKPHGSDAKRVGARRAGRGLQRCGAFAKIPPPKNPEPLSSESYSLFNSEFNAPPFGRRGVYGFPSANLTWGVK